MLISQKQHQANRRNAQRSTGPTTPEGIQAAALNAVTYGLRTRRLIIRGEDIGDYWRLWDGLENEWRPETDTERLYLEQMSVSQWLLARMAASEQQVYEQNLPLESRFDLLDRIARHNTRLERSFTTAMHELKQLQKERKAQTQKPGETSLSGGTGFSRSSQAPVPHPNGGLSDSAEEHPGFCAPASTDTR